MDGFLQQYILYIFIQTNIRHACVASTMLSQAGNCSHQTMENEVLRKIGTLFHPLSVENVLHKCKCAPEDHLWNIEDFSIVWKSLGFSHFVDWCSTPKGGEIDLLLLDRIENHFLIGGGGKDCFFWHHGKEICTVVEFWCCSNAS